MSNNSFKPFKPRGPVQSKPEARAEAERLVKEALEKRNLNITQGQTTLFVKCVRCGYNNKVMRDGDARVSFKCRECDTKQVAL